jgi:hypothetical protein
VVDDQATLLSPGLGWLPKTHMAVRPGSRSEKCNRIPPSYSLHSCLDRPLSRQEGISSFDISSPSDERAAQGKRLMGHQRGAGLTERSARLLRLRATHTSVRGKELANNPAPLI